MMPSKLNYEAVRDIATNLLGSLDLVVIHDGDLEAEFIDHLAEAMDIILVTVLGWSAALADNTSYEAIIEWCDERIEELDA